MKLDIPWLRSWRCKNGFTLIELLLVIFLLSLVAVTVAAITDGITEQGRYDETRRRISLIRQAIVGNDAHSLNNQPSLDGFSADMGRLPACVRELLEPISCPPANDPLAIWGADPDSGLWAGWRGPYVEALPESDGQKTLRDGYGNLDTEPEDGSYGWDYAVSGDTLALNSLGLDAADSSDDVVVPELVLATDFRADFTLVRVSLINRSRSNMPGPAPQLLLQVYYAADGVIDVRESVAFDGIVNSPVQVSDPMLTEQREVTFTPALLPTQGVRGYAVVCASNGGLYDSTNCTGTPPLPLAEDIIHFTVAPRTLPYVLDWNI